MNKIKLITDIVTALRKNNLCEHDTDEDLIKVYDALIDMGNVFYIYEDGKLQGFLDGIRFPEEPHSEEEFLELIHKYPNNTGRVAVIMNCCVEVKGRDFIHKLVDLAQERYPDIEVIVWRNAKHNRFFSMTMEKRRRQQCKETAVS